MQVPLPNVSTPVLPGPIKRVGAKLLVPLHRAIFDASQGRVFGRVGTMPVVKLTTNGRRSGQPRTVMLTSPARAADGSLVVVASWGGDDAHPAWYLNLEADPQVEVTAEGRTFTATARTASAEERDALWPTVVATYDSYAGYQRATDREIPLVVLEES